jgi:hypothetical protein
MLACLAVESGYGRNGTHCAAHDWLRGSAVFALRQDRGTRQEMVRGCGIPQVRLLAIAEKRCRFAHDCNSNTLPGTPNLLRADSGSPANLLFPAVPHFLNNATIICISPSLPIVTCSFRPWRDRDMHNNTPISCGSRLLSGRRDALMRGHCKHRA